MKKEILKKIFSYKINMRGLFNPFIGLQISSLGNYRGINDIKREIPIIVNLSSSRERFSELVITIYSILNQSLKPDKIILWLDEEYEDLVNLPYDITQFIKNGLEIRFVKNVGPYTKTLYAFKEFSKSIIVSADDGVFYPENWLKSLYLSYVSNPDEIHVHRAIRVSKNSLGEISSHINWTKNITETSARFDNFMTNIGGILYPPNCFTNEVLREDVFLKTSPDIDNIWLWIMAIVHGRKIRVVQNCIKTFIYTNIWKQIFIYNREEQKINKKFDEQLQKTIKYYYNNVYNKL